MPENRDVLDGITNQLLYQLTADVVQRAIATMRS